MQTGTSLYFSDDDFLVAQQLYRKICMFVCLGVHVYVFVCVFGHATYKLEN